MVTSSCHFPSDALFLRIVHVYQNPDGKNDSYLLWVGLNIGKSGSSVKQKPKGVKGAFVYLIKKLGKDQENNGRFPIFGILLTLLTDEGQDSRSMVFFLNMKK
jgi:hypothetical protein